MASTKNVKLEIISSMAGPSAPKVGSIIECDLPTAARYIRNRVGRIHDDNAPQTERAVMSEIDKVKAQEAKDQLAELKKNQAKKSGI